jgi:hypothetical protein
MFLFLFCAFNGTPRPRGLSGGPQSAFFQYLLAATLKNEAFHTPRGKTTGHRPGIKNPERALGIII